MISLLLLPASATTIEGRYRARRSRPFQFGMTTDAASVDGRESSGSLFFRNREARSVSASAATAAVSNTGEMTSNGSDRISRHRMVRNVLTRRGSQDYSILGPSLILRPRRIQRDACTRPSLAES